MSDEQLTPTIVYDMLKPAFPQLDAVAIKDGKIVVFISEPLKNLAMPMEIDGLPVVVKESGGKIRAQL